MTIEARATAERLGDDLDPKVRFAFGTRTRMAGMAVGFIDHA